MVGQSASTTELTDRQKEVRRKMLAKIHILWKETRPDLRHSTEELKAELREFARAELELGETTSLSNLTNQQLGELIEAIQWEKTHRQLPKREPQPINPEHSAEIIHLAGPEQVWAINKVLDYIGWTPEGREEFLFSKFRRKSPRMLTPDQTRAYLVILFNVAASRDLKKERGEDAVISREEMRAYMPKMKATLGLGQRASRS